MNLGPTELIIILVIVLVLFGSTRLPKLARSMGQASKEFKKGIDEGDKSSDEDKPEKKEDSA
jgi:sec-independent protein translocase protein TatA